MNSKKLLPGMLAVALIATMSFVFTACSKDDDKEKVDYSKSIIGKWVYYNHYYSTGIDIPSTIEFKTDNTYSYDNLIFGSGSGYYRILESQKSTGVIHWSYKGYESEEEFDGVLCKMLASGNSDFDQMWVYKHMHEGQTQIYVEFYSSHNERLDIKHFGQINDPGPPCRFLQE